MKKLIIIFLFILVVLSQVSCSKTAETINVLAILPLTGNISKGGINIKDGLELAVTKVNSREVIKGKILNLIVLDSKSSPKTAITAFKNGVEKYNPLFVISCHSFKTKPLSIEAEKLKVPLIGIVVSSYKFLDGKKYSYTFYPTALDQASIITRQIKETRTNTLGILYINDAFGNSLKTALENNLKDTGIKSESFSFNHEFKNYESTLKKLLNFQGICIIGFVDIIPKFVKQLRQLKYHGKIFTNISCAIPELIANKDFNDIYLPSPLIYNTKISKVNEVTSDFEKRFKKPFNFYIANAYDLIMMLSDLIDKDKIKTRTELVDSISKGFIYNGLMGTVITEKNKNNFPFPLFKARIIDGRMKFE